MDFQPKAVPGPMEEALHSPLGPACLVTFLGEEIEHALMDLPAMSFIMDLFEGQLLSALDGMIHSAERFAGAPPGDCSRNVPKIAGLLRAREDIEDDRLVGTEKAVAHLVGVAALPAAGHDRMGRPPASLENGRLD